MGRLTTLLVVVIAIGAAGIGFYIFTDGELPVFSDQYWGMKANAGVKEDVSIRPFEINVTKKELTDLNTRLKLEFENNKFTPPLEGIGFEYGLNTKFLKKVIQHWLEKYDWRQREKNLNKYPHFKTKISGLDIHFQHIKSKNNKNYKKTRPLLLVNGWPGSFVELQKMIPILLDPKDSEINFELVIAEIPGFGFSEAAHRPGLGAVEVSQIFQKLMIRLGHSKFYIHGYDWGSLIAVNMATMFEKNVLGIHQSMCLSLHPRSHIRIAAAFAFPQLLMDKDEVKHFFPVTELVTKLMRESGYIHSQSTKPDTIGVALQNSPSGLAAYILEKFSFWTNANWLNKEDGGIIPHFNLDDLLDNIMVYWFTDSITTSMRMYAENFSPSTTQWTLDRVPTSVPTGCLNMPNEIIAQPKFALGDKYRDIVRFSYAETGGHLGGFEVPDLVAKNVVITFNLIESSLSSQSKNSDKTKS